MAMPVENIVNQSRAFWGGLSGSRKVGLVGVTLVVMVALGSLAVLGGRPAYRPLFVNLGQEDAAAIVDRLRERKVPYRLGAGGRAVEVPEDRLYETRLNLATDGLPQGGGVGFELFDRQAFGATEFVQRVNLQRALQGELARTIRQFPQVAQARVHLSVPERSLFVREAERPHGTVVLQLHPGTTLQPAQMQGIVHLVSSAVPGMSPQDVHLVDTTGKVLYSSADGEGAGGASGRVLERQVEMERRLEAKIHGMLEPVLGPQKVVARVHVDLDARRVEQTEEQFDPDKSAVRSEQRSTERSTGGGFTGGGVPGVVSNLTDPKAGSSQAAAGPTSQRESETVNYEVNRLTRRTLASGGDVRRLTVAVLVDGIRKPAAGGEGKEAWTVVARPAEELKQYEEIVKQAVGFNPQRGDQLQVASAPFERMQDVASPSPGGLAEIGEALGGGAARHGLALVLALVLLLAVVRPLVRGVVRAIQSAPREAALPRALGVADGRARVPLPSSAASPPGLLPQEVVQMAQVDPQRFAAALKTWMKQGE
jgi:flagellar M-ring protein FliF